ncbi:MAG: TolC family protein [Steroidobacteraceae bacterium]
MRNGLVGGTFTLLCALLLHGCAVPSARENFDATAKLVAREAPQGLAWRLDAAADAQAARTVEALRADGITASEAVAIAFLANPEVQLAIEKTEISRAEYVAAATPPNPYAIVGVRQPGGRYAAFYPRNNISIGALQNVLALLNGPERRRIARIENERARAEAADQILGIAARVQQAYIESVAADQVAQMRAEALQFAQRGIDSMQAAKASALNLALERNTIFGVQQAVWRAQLDARTARAKLAQLLGLANGGDSLKLSSVLPELPAADPVLGDLERLALERRLDLIVARAAIEGRVATLRAQRHWRWLGSLELGAFIERAADGTSFIGPNAVVELPLLDQRQSQLLINDSQMRTALRTLQLLWLAARTDIQVHAAELATTRDMSQRYRNEVLPNHADIRARVAQEPDATVLDHTRMARSDLAAREEAVGALRDYWRARSALARASGDWSALNAWPIPK